LKPSRQTWNNLIFNIPYGAVYHSPIVFNKNMELPKRKLNRLKNYDYSTNGAYFVTICTDNRKSLLSHIYVGQGLAPAANKLSIYGKIAEEQLLTLEDRYPTVTIDKYVIMPNHIHVIIWLNNETAGASPCPTLSDVICAFKSLTTRYCKQKHDIPKIFQTSFHDHIIRDEQDYLKIWEYIDTNPIKWKDDCFYIPENS